MAKPTVLVIDDERYFLLVTKELVEEQGYNAIISDDVEEGVKLFYEKKPDLLIMDIIMPKEFGTEVCRDLKETEQGQNTPIILMSSGVKEMAEGDGLVEYKADEYILKPFEKNIFLGLLIKYLQKAPHVTPASITQTDIRRTGEITRDSWFDGAEVKSLKKPKTSKAFETLKVTDDVVKLQQGEGGLILTIQVESKTKYVFTGNSMINVNTGGIFVTAESPAPLGTKIEIKMNCSGDNIDLKGMVVWVQPANIKTGQPSGMGIRFSDQKSEFLVKLKTYLKSLGA